MKKFTIPLVLLLVCSVTYWACNKKELAPIATPSSNATAMEAYNAITRQIANAKAYFVSNVDTNVVQKFKKSALWDRAYIGHFKTGDKVIVPLRYNKNYVFTTNYSGDKKFVMGKVNCLFIDKDSTGAYHAAIITVIPNKSALDNPEQPFSGYVKYTDWADNNIKTYHYINGTPYVKLTATVSPNSVMPAGNVRVNSVLCYSTDYYLCPEDAVTTGDCTYLFTTSDGCYDDQGVAVPQDEIVDGGGGSEVVSDDFNFSLSVNWLVYSDTYSEVWSPEVIAAVKSFTDRTTAHNHFTGITSGGSYLNPWATDQLGTPIASGYVQDVKTTSVSDLSISSNVSGHYFEENVNNFLKPTGGNHLVTSPNYKSWAYSDLVPN